MTVSTIHALTKLMPPADDETDVLAIGCWQLPNSTIEMRVYDGDELHPTLGRLIGASEMSPSLGRHLNQFGNSIGAYASPFRTAAAVVSVYTKYEG